MRRITINQLLTTHQYTQYIQEFYKLDCNYVYDLKPFIENDSLMNQLEDIIKNQKEAQKVYHILYRRYQYELISSYLKLSLCTILIAYLIYYVFFF